jgi:hypothetical protein
MTATVERLFRGFLARLSPLHRFLHLASVRLSVERGRQLGLEPINNWFEAYFLMRGMNGRSPLRTRLAGGGEGLRTIGPLASSVINKRQIEFSEMHRGEFGGGLFAPDLPEPTAQQGDDFLLNLRIVQQTQERPFESLVLLRLLDLVFSFGSILHGF